MAETVRFSLYSQTQLDRDQRKNLIVYYIFLLVDKSQVKPTLTELASVVHVSSV